MPFRSKSQQRWMYANRPEMAAKWEDKYGIPNNLPEHKKAIMSALKKRKNKGK
jgi:hypothetical protein